VDNNPPVPGENSDTKDSSALTWMMNWVYDHAPIKSGTANFRILLWGTYIKAYSRYKQDATPLDIPVLSQATFFNTLHRLEIKKRTFDKYLCPVESPFRNTVGSP